MQTLAEDLAKTAAEARQQMIDVETADSICSLVDEDLVSADVRDIPERQKTRFMLHCTSCRRPVPTVLTPQGMGVEVACPRKGLTSWTHQGRSAAFLPRRRTFTQSKPRKAARPTQIGEKFEN